MQSTDPLHPLRPGDSHQKVTDTAARDEWVEAQLTRNFMRHALSALHATVPVIPVMVAVLYNDVDNLALLCWALVAVLMLIGRYAVVYLYRRDYAHAGAERQRAFMARYGWTWTLSAVVWGASMFLHYRQAPVSDQFVCMIVLVGMAGFAVGAFSASLRRFVSFTNGLGYTILAAMVYSVLIERVFPDDYTAYALALLVLVYWSALRTTGKRLHEMQRSNLELQFTNTGLITSLIEKTRTALEAVDTKNRFIASAAHDLRQPVHALSLYADWLRTEPEFVMQITPKIVQSTQAINELFNSLFDLARLDASTIEVNWQRVDVPALLDELELQYLPLARERGVFLRKRVRPLQVRSDPVLLKRLLGNLLSNALRHTARGGVLLAVRHASTGPCIEVWDTGVGIAPEYQQAIFQEFYRVVRHNGTEEGFGLGLAIVSRLCQALGHRLSMHSRLGRGTVFRLQLQAFDEAPASASSSPASASAATRT
jgi:signal transduction histidine kinase